jgi:hypothetical protein
MSLGPEQDLINLSKSKEFKAHIACLKKNPSIKAKVAQLEADFKTLEKQVAEKKDMVNKPYDMLKSISLSIEMLTTVRDIIAIQRDDTYLDTAIDSCPKTMKSVSKVSNNSEIRHLDDALAQLHKVQKNAKKRKQQ